MNTTLEDRIARALDRRPDAPMHVDLDAVRRGARHRRARRRAVTALAVAALAGGAVAAIAVRATEHAPEAPATSPQPPPFGAAALLPADIFGPPTEVDVDRGATYGVALPQTDVWESPEGRIVVHTRLAAGAPMEEIPATTAPASVAVPSSGDVVDVAGAADGVVEQLADDQWVIYLTPEREQGDLVIARGMTRGEAERAFRSLVTVDGVLQPAAGYQLVEHADAVPASPVPVGWATSVGFGAEPEFAGIPGSYVGVSEPVFGRDTIELTASWWPVALIDVDGREVAEVRPNESQSSFLWRDASGVFVTVWSFDGSITRDSIGDVIGDTRLIGPGELLSIADSISAARATKPEVAQGQVGSVTITQRGTPTDVVLCLGSAGEQQCTAEPNASLNDPPINSVVDAIVDGQWIIAGVYELSSDRERPDLTDERYTLADGTDAPITIVESDGRLWWTALVPADVDRITTHSSNDTGVIVGTIVRPVVMGPLG